MKTLRRSFRLLIGFVLTVGAMCGAASSGIAADSTSNPPAAKPKVKIVLAGDSTVTDKAGWGVGFAKCLGPDAVCVNLSRGGRSSKSFIDEGSWKKCLDEKPDYVLIQFGHNDQPGKGPERETDPATTYRQFMTQYIDEARAAGIKPVLVTSLSRRQWGNDGKIHSTLTPYVDVVKEIAAAKQVPLIDLHARSIELYEQLGKEGCWELSPPKDDAYDNTHLNEKGSAVIGPIVAAELAKVVSDLAPFIVATNVEAVGAASTKETGPFQPTWESLAASYQCPEWFHDAKFGIWAHWSAQCQPERGDWYGRRMYIQGEPQYKDHLERFGHPSEVGFMEMDNLWKADKWEPEKLMRLYKEAGAKYFVALANHHDNFDCYDSKYHDWNSVRIGPKKDIVGTWEKVARAAGLRFGVSNHSAHAWHWFQPAYGYDPEGDKAGIRYDAFRLTKADGKGKWWEGLDPQDLYTGRNMAMPDGIKTIKEADEWHKKHDAEWTEAPPADNPEFVKNWLLRANDLVDKYHPDLVYLDNTELPLGQAGLDFAAHYYNSNLAHFGKLEAVLTAKKIKPEHAQAVVADFERGAADEIQPLPWQTCSCIGQWHYQENCDYKSVGQVVRMLVNIVSKNGCLLLSIPVRGDGTIDDKEVAFLKDMGKWMRVNGEGLYGSRPWHISGEGPTTAKAGMFGEKDLPYTPTDMRFTTKDGALYVFVLKEPTEAITVKSLASSAEFSKPIANVALVGSEESLNWKQSDDGLVINKPAKSPSENVIAFKVTFK